MFDVWIFDFRMKGGRLGNDQNLIVCLVLSGFCNWERESMSGGTQKSLRKALGALKDTTTVSLAKVNSDYKVE